MKRLEAYVKKTLEKPKHTSSEAIEQARQLFATTDASVWEYPINQAKEMAYHSGKDRILALAYLAEHPTLSGAQKLQQAAKIYKEAAEPYQESLKIYSYNPFYTEKPPKSVPQGWEGYGYVITPVAARRNIGAIRETLTTVLQYQTRRRIFELGAKALQFLEPRTNSRRQT